MRLLQAVKLIDEHAMEAGCEAVPDIRIVLMSKSDQNSFDDQIKIELTNDLKDVVQYQPSLFGSINLEIDHVTVEIHNSDRGARAEGEAIIRRAEKALKEASGGRVRAVEIVEMRNALTDLLRLVRG